MIMFSVLGVFLPWSMVPQCGAGGPDTSGWQRPHPSLGEELVDDGLLQGQESQGHEQSCEEGSCPVMD